MLVTQNDIISQLKREILPLEGYKPVGKNDDRIDLGPINESFPNKTFPIGSVHEFLFNNDEAASSTIGFVSGILKHILKIDNGIAIWISASRKIFPPSFLCFGIKPENVIFIDLPSEKDVFTATLDCLKCEGVSAVISEAAQLDFTQTRKLQLAVEASRVTGFILKNTKKTQGHSACVARWVIAPVPGNIIQDLPGVGQIQWNVQLKKIRNGKPGQWTLGWFDTEFNFAQTENHTSFMHEEMQRKKAG